MGMVGENPVPSGGGMKGFGGIPLGGFPNAGGGMHNDLAGGFPMQGTSMGASPFMPQAPQGYPSGYPLPGNIFQSYSQQTPGMYTGQGQGFQGAGQGFQGNMGPMAPGSTQSNPAVASHLMHNNIHPISMGGTGGGGGGGGQQNYLFNSTRFM